MQNLFKVLFLFVFISFFCESLLAQSLSDSSPTIKTYKTSSASTHSVYVESGSSGATSVSNAHSVYIPISKSENEGYHISHQTNNTIPEIADATTGSGSVVFSSLSLTSSGSDYIYLAIQDESDSSTWNVVYKSSLQTSTGTKEIEVPIINFCGEDLDCSNLYTSVATTATTDSTTFYIFASSADIDPNGTPVTTSDTGSYPGVDSGVYYKVYLSDKISSSNVKLNSLSKGDEQIIANFTGFSLSNVRSLYYYAIKAASPDGVCPQDEDSVITYKYWERATTTGSQTFVNDSLDYTGTSGILTIDNLENNYCYSVRLYYRDKFGFASLLSKRINQTPENIETLLETQQCYLLTAGFNGDHPVVRFFRDFRDTILMKYWLGRTFINFYYETAPQYTGYILKTPWLQMMIRSISTSLYYTLRFWQASLFFLFLMVLGYTLRRIRLI